MQLFIAWLSGEQGSEPAKELQIGTWSPGRLASGIRHVNNPLGERTGAMSIRHPRNKYCRQRRDFCKAYRSGAVLLLGLACMAETLRKSTFVARQGRRDYSLINPKETLSAFGVHESLLRSEPSVAMYILEEL